MSCHHVISKVLHIFEVPATFLASFCPGKGVFAPNVILESVALTDHPHNVQFPQANQALVVDLSCQGLGHAFPSLSINEYDPWH